MSGSLEVQKFLSQQQEDFAPRQSSTVPGQRTGEDSRISMGQVERARLAVAGLAHDAEDCELLLDMLGLVPDENGVPPIRR
jgi:hypothetical protein